MSWPVFVTVEGTRLLLSGQFVYWQEKGGCEVSLGGDDRYGFPQTTVEQMDMLVAAAIRAAQGTAADIDERARIYAKRHEGLI